MIKIGLSWETNNRGNSEISNMMKMNLFLEIEIIQTFNTKINLFNLELLRTL